MRWLGSPSSRKQKRSSHEVQFADMVTVDQVQSVSIPSANEKNLEPLVTMYLQLDLICGT